MEISISDAAELLVISRQAVHAAIHRGRLKTFVGDDNRLKVLYEEVVRYSETKYSRTESTLNGALIFDKERGYYSVNECAVMLGVPTQHVYFLVRAKKLNAEKRGVMLVIKLDDIRAYKEKHFPNLETNSQVG